MLIFNRLRNVVFCLVLLIPIVLYGCSPTYTPGPSSLVFGCRRAEFPAFQEAIDSFRQRYPHIRVQLVALEELVPAGAPDDLSRLHSAARQVDVFLWSERGVEGGPAGILADLSPYVRDNANMDEQVFWPGLLRRFQDQGKTWGIPAVVNPIFVLYHPAVFDELNLPYPNAEWTWADFVQTAQLLVKQEDGEFVCRGALVDLESLRAVIAGLGGRLATEVEGRPVPTLDAAAMVEAVQRILGLIDQGALVNPTQGTVDPIHALKEQQVAMAVISAQVWNTLSSEQQADLQVAALPNPGLIGSRGYVISAGTPDLQMAWLLLDFFSQNVVLPGTWPARQQMASPEDVVSDDALSQVLAFASAHALPPVRPQAVETAFNAALSQILHGAEVDAVLAAAQQSVLSLQRPQFEPFAVSIRQSVSESEQTRITFVAPFAQAYEPLAEAFQVLHPDIRVVVREAVDATRYRPWKDMAELLQLSQADCARGSAIVSDKQIRDALIRVQPWVDADASFPIDDYLPGTLETVRYAGDLWGIPAGQSVSVLYYNRALFDQAGLDYPQASWSWNDLFEQARLLAQNSPSDKRIYGLVVDPGLSMGFLLRYMHGDLVERGAFKFDNPVLVGSLRQLSDLVGAQVIPADDDQTLTALIYQDRVGMWIAPARSFQTPEHDYVPALIPGFRYSGGGSSAYFISAQSPHPEACWTWLRFLADRIPYDPDPRGEHAIVPELPPRRTLLVSEVFGEQVGIDAQKIYLTALEQSSTANLFTTPAGFPDYAGQAYLFLYRSAASVVWQGADAQTELAQAQFKADAYLACLRRQSEQDAAAAQACFEQVEADTARP